MKYLIEMKTIFISVVMVSLLGCEALQEIDGRPENTASTMIDSLREQREQTGEITDASGEVEDILDLIDREAESILNDIALVPQDRNYNLDPTFNSIEGSAENIKENVDDAQKEQIRIEEALEDLSTFPMLTRARGGIARIE